jgi:transposase
LGCDREQTFLLPPSLDEWLPPDHFARFVIAAVEAMDLSAFYGDYRADGHGRPAHDPAMMLALLMYAYARGERSSRAIERGCFEDIAMRFIAANRQPDHDDRAVSSAPRARDRGVVRTGPRPLRARRPGNEHQIVVAAEVSVSSADFGQMAPMIDKARAELTAAGVDEQPGVPGRRPLGGGSRGRQWDHALSPGREVLGPGESFTVPVELSERFVGPRSPTSGCTQRFSLKRPFQVLSAYRCS